MHKSCVSKRFQSIMCKVVFSLFTKIFCFCGLVMYLHALHAKHDSNVSFELFSTVGVFAFYGH